MLSARFLYTASVLVDSILLVHDELIFISMFLSYVFDKINFKKGMQEC